MAPPSSTVARWELARRLTARRKSFGIDHKTIASRLDFSRNYWSAVENERTLLSRDKLEEAIELFEFDEEAAQELRELRELARTRGWWQALADRFDDESTKLFGLEYGASLIRTYDGLTIPGLLQIPDYAQAVIESDPSMSRVGVDDAVNIRTQRQQRLTDEDPVEFSAIVSQAALTQQWAGPGVQAKQLRHIEELSKRDNIQIRVLPFESAPGIIATASTLVFFTFRSRYLPTVAFQEVVRLLSPVYDGQIEFRRLELCWNEGRRRALSPIDSMERIRELRKDFEMGDDRR